jgi:hypothetical protein
VTGRVNILALRGRAAVVFGVVIFLVFAGAGASSAYWTASSTVGATATTATLSTSVAGTNVLNTTYKFAAPATTSPTVIAAPAIAIANTGTAPLTYTVATSASAATVAPASIQLSLWTTGGSNCGTSPPAAQGTLAAFPTFSTAAPVAAGATYHLCAATQLMTSVAASQGGTITLNFTVTGHVGANWSTAAAVSATQTVFRIPAVTGVTCVSKSLTGLASYITLSWTLPTTATGVSITVTPNGTGGVAYGGTLLVRDFSRSGLLGPSTAVGSSATQLSLVVIESQYGTTSTPVTQKIVQTAGLGGALAGIACG